MTPPGLAFVTASDAALARSRVLAGQRRVVRRDRRANANRNRRPAGGRGTRARHGIVIANGQGQLLGRVFRIGHIGDIHPEATLATLRALEPVLASLGFRAQGTVEEAFAHAARDGTLERYLTLCPATVEKAISIG